MRRLLTIAITVALTVPAVAQTRRLTLDDIFDRQKKLSFSTTQNGFTWLDDTHYFYPHAVKGEVDSEVLVDASTGKSVAFFDVDALEGQIAKIEGVTPEEAKKLARPRSVNLSGNKQRILLDLHEDLYSYDLAKKSLTRLTNSAGSEENATFSPDGSRVGFVRNNDLFVVDVASGTEQRLTTDGADDILNGKLDWVYQEEIYGRGTFSGYWWSPDSRSIAYLRFDEKKVPKFTVVDHMPLHQEIENTPYPKAGDPNPAVSLHVIDLGTHKTVRITTEPNTNGDFLIADVAWQPDSSRVFYQWQDREQTWLDLMAAPRDGGAPVRVLRETTKAWVEPQGSPRWLRDGSFLWLSERSGYKHLYRVAKNGTQTQLTHGDWEVRTLHGVDEKAGYIYFSGTERSAIGSDVYRIRLDGSGLQRLSTESGTHTATFNPSSTMYLDNWSNATTPPRTTLHRATTGALVRTVDENSATALANFDLVKPEFLQVKTRDGFVMEAMLIRPANFDPSKKYPVFEHTYSGPHAPQVADRWGGSTYLWHQFLAQNGIAVWILDNRTASGKGAVSTWPAYKAFGPLELRDLEDGVTWLKSQPWVDGSRILLNGWSYGGFMTTFALTHSDVFRAGIAGGPVTDWHDYDSIYTERYMLTPEHNKEGYEKTSPQKAAANLHGDLLLLHGAMDDNVHVQNTIQFAYALQKAGKVFDMNLYAKSRHGVTDPDLAKQLRLKMWDFVQRELLR